MTRVIAFHFFFSLKPIIFCTILKMLWNSLALVMILFLCASIHCKMLLFVSVLWLIVFSGLLADIKRRVKKNAETSKPNYRNGSGSRPNMRASKIGRLALAGCSVVHKLIPPPSKAARTPTQQLPLRWRRQAKGGGAKVKIRLCCFSYLLIKIFT